MGKAFDKMTTGTLQFAIPPERLGRDPSIYLNPEIGPSWPQEPYEVTLQDLKAELENAENAKPLDSRGFAILRNRSESLGPLKLHEIWNADYLEETKQMIKTQLGADEAFIWNSVTRSADPSVLTPYGNNHFQDKAIVGLQFGAIIRGTASGAHVDQDVSNSQRMCRAAAGGDVFQKYSRVQQLNIWRPLKGPVTSKPLAVCDGSTVPDKSKSIHCGHFGTRVLLHHDVNQNWYYIKRQGPEDCFILKIYDSAVLPGQAEFAPHTGVDDLHGADGPEEPRESIEVRVVVCYL
ncbi:hypothetical protein B0O99DRAFT_632435 [Bisporella sp. PMI_857]|nr:hypothetical protein B0O99DRAFT_632435 [Bisporella sp. PMI_857]